MFGCSDVYHWMGRAAKAVCLPDCGPTSVPLQSGAAPPVKYAQARNTRRVILVTVPCSFWLSTIRHASERRIKTLAALPGGNPAPQKAASR
jgi:hypothetical protein